MSSAGDKVRGKGEELLGKAKQGIGSATGDERLEAEGHADETKGKARGVLGDVKDTVNTAIGKVVGHDEPDRASDDKARG